VDQGSIAPTEQTIPTVTPTSVVEPIANTPFVTYALDPGSTVFASNVHHKNGKVEFEPVLSQKEVELTLLADDAKAKAMFLFVKAGALKEKLEKEAEKRKEAEKAKKLEEEDVAKKEQEEDENMKQWDKKTELLEGGAIPEIIDEEQEETKGQTEASISEICTTEVDADLVEEKERNEEEEEEELFDYIYVDPEEVDIFFDDVDGLYYVRN
jgi:hypothetical protein